MSTHLGSVTVTVANRTRGADTVEFELNDEESGCRIVTMSLSYDQWGKIVSGRGVVPVKFEATIKNLGKKHEHKTEFVPVPEGASFWKNNALKDELLKPFDIDGWRGSREDLGNHHRATRKDNIFGYKVTFHRWVPTKES